MTMMMSLRRQVTIGRASKVALYNSGSLVASQFYELWALRVRLSMQYAPSFGADTRKIFQKQLSRQTSAIFQDNQSRQAAILAQNLLETPDKFEVHIQRYPGLVLVRQRDHGLIDISLCRFASAVVMEIAYGHHVSSPDDPYLRIADKINELVAGIGAQGSNLVDLFPFC